MQALPSLDADFTAKAVAADKEGKVLRYVATVQAKQCIVGIKALSKDSPIGTLLPIFFCSGFSVFRVSTHSWLHMSGA